MYLYPSKPIKLHIHDIYILTHSAFVDRFLYVNISEDSALNKGKGVDNGMFKGSRIKIGACDIVNMCSLYFDSYF